MTFQTPFEKLLSKEAKELVYDNICHKCNTLRDVHVTTRFGNISYIMTCGCTKEVPA